MLDTSLTYIFALSKLNGSEYIEYPQECKLVLFGKNNDHCRVESVNEGYRTKSFDCLFVEWMLYRGQARIKNSLNNRYNIWVGPWHGSYLDPVQYEVVSEEYIYNIINRLNSQREEVKENIRLLFNVPINKFDYYANMLIKHLCDWKNLLLFTYQEVGIDNISGWEKQGSNFINISTKEPYYV